MRAFLLLFAVAATGLVVWLVLSEGDEARGGRTRGIDAPAEPPPRAPEAVGGGGPEKTPAATGRTFSLAGYVRDPGGAAVPGAVVRLTVTAGSVSDTTGAEGEYALEAPVPHGAFDVWAFGFLPIVGTVNGLPSGETVVFEGEGPWRKDFVLRPAAALSGFVHDQAGQPVAGARVYVIPAGHALLDRETVANVVTTDEKGEFGFPGLPAGVTDLGCRAPGFLPSIVKDVAIPERGTARQDLRLSPGREVKVTVLNDPADRFDQLRKKAVAEGKDPGDWSDAVRAGMPPAELVTRVIAADSRLKTMLLPPGGTDALADAYVGRSLAGLAVAWARRVGERYEVTGLGLGPADIAVRPGPFGDVIVEPGLGEKLDTTEAEVTLTLVPGTRITVNVRDAVTGNPLEPEVTRRTVGVATPLPVERESASCLVPCDGRRHALVFTLDGYQEATLDLPDLRTVATSPQRPTFDVAMQPTAAGETGAFYVVFDPPLNGRIALVGRDATGAPRWQKHIDAADKEGKWAVEEVPVGEYAVSVLATGMVPAFLPRVVVARGLKDTYRVTLTAGGGLSLKVTDAEGQVLDQVHLMLKDQAGNQIDVHVMSHVSEGRAFLSINYLPTAAAAKADSGLAPGFYEIAVYREGFDVGRKSFEVRGTDVAEVEIALPKAAPK